MSDPAADPIPIEALYDQTRVSDLALSPDGERIAYVTEEFDRGEDERRQSVHVVPADGSRNPHRLTRASDAHSPKWSPDGSRVGVLAARERDVELVVGETDEDEGGENEGSNESGENGASGDEDGDDDPKPQVWVFDLELGVGMPARSPTARRVCGDSTGDPRASGWSFPRAIRPTPNASTSNGVERAATDDGRTNDEAGEHAKRDPDGVVDYRITDPREILAIVGLDRDG